MFNTIYTFLIVLIVFTGCSSKQYYEPENTISHDMKVYDNDANIISITPNGATLENMKFISKGGTSSFSLETGYEFLNDINGTIIAANDDGNLSVNTNNDIQHYKFKKRVISASNYKNKLALLFVDNSIALYDTTKKAITFKEYYSASALNDVNIASPIFLTSVVLLPTLDGKIIVVNFKTNQLVKTINVDPQSKINNIIYFSSIKDTLVAATPKKLFVFLNGNVKVKELDIKDVVLSKSNIFVATLDGQIIKYDHSLNEIKSKKYRFAKFYTIGYTKYIYALESQGYLIRLSNDFKEENVYDLSFDEDEEATILGDTLYFDEEYIKLP